MREGRASLTALAVAAARALRADAPGGVLRPCSGDTLARRVLPRPLACPIAWMGPVRPVSAFLLSKLSLGLVDHVALRSARIDALIDDWVTGLLGQEPQLVVLGAGLDTRAHRLGSTAGLRVFEVDHPDSQRVKRARARGLPVVARALSYVDLDLTGPSLAARLAKTGHDPGQPSFWGIEAVAPYLSHEALAGILTDVVARSSAGSALALTYVTPDLAWLRRLPAFSEFTMNLIGEPVGGRYEPAAMRELLTDRGLRVERDEDTHDWARAAGVALPRLAYERMAFARSGPTAASRP